MCIHITFGIYRKPTNTDLIIHSNIRYTISEILNNDTETPTIEKQELEILSNNIFEHNYMQFSDQFYNQNEGLAMGAPTSAIVAEIFIQHLNTIR
jgi:hypothetical protein